MSLHRTAWAAALVLLMAVLAACSGAATTEPVVTSQVDLPPSYRFEPQAIAVPDGTKVTWTNHDNFTHNVRLLDDGGEILPLPPGESASFTFTGPGQHRYDCSLHPNDMSGVVIVSDS
jgi:plastocyanin